MKDCGARPSVQRKSTQCSWKDYGKLSFIFPLFSLVESRGRSLSAGLEGQRAWWRDGRTNPPESCYQRISKKTMWELILGLGPKKTWHIWGGLFSPSQRLIPAKPLSPFLGVSSPGTGPTFLSLLPTPFCSASPPRPLWLCPGFLFSHLYHLCWSLSATP